MQSLQSVTQTVAIVPHCSFAVFLDHSLACAVQQLLQFLWPNAALSLTPDKLEDILRCEMLD